MMSIIDNSHYISLSIDTNAFTYVQDIHNEWHWHISLSAQDWISQQSVRNGLFPGITWTTISTGP